MGQLPGGDDRTERLRGWEASIMGGEALALGRGPVARRKGAAEATELIEMIMRIEL